ncbi:MAG: hypothetical protein OET90_04655 [Desulfuromonadales bacterium]|nr:hypothetical protein [Desulfuromonadales bacterium]
MDNVELKNKLNKATTALESYKFPWIWWWIVTLLIAAIYTSLYLKGDGYSRIDQDFLLPMILGVTLGGAFWSTIIVGGISQSKKSNLERKRSNLLVQTLNLETEDLQTDLETDFFTNLVKINFKYLDKYYLQTQVQADKSFWLSVSAALTGLLLVSIGVILLYKGKIEPGNVTATAGIIGEFISAVFFYLYNRTVSKMAGYHQKLVLTQNVSLALKIADDLPDKEKGEAKMKLVDSLSKDINMFLSGSNNRINPDA